MVSQSLKRATFSRLAWFHVPVETTEVTFSLRKDRGRQRETTSVHLTSHVEAGRSEMTSHLGPAKGKDDRSQK